MGGGVLLSANNPQEKDGVMVLAIPTTFMAISPKGCGRIQVAEGIFGPMVEVTPSGLKME